MKVEAARLGERYHTSEVVGVRSVHDVDLRPHLSHLEERIRKVSPLSADCSWRDQKFTA